MRFLHGSLKAHIGDLISVEPSRPTRVLIMTDREFNKYKNNMSFTYYGGHKDARYDFTVPKSGTWRVVIEKGIENAMSVSANITITRGAAKQLSQSNTAAAAGADPAPEAEAAEDTEAAE